MMGQQQQPKELFSYQIDLDRRVRADNPLRQVAGAIDFSFARAEVEPTYGHNGNVSVDPAVILKMMFLLFFDNVRSERQLMEILPERLDYLWFLGYGINDPVPDHSVLSKARARWGSARFEQLFVRTVAACVSAGLVDGKKIHVDGSLIAAQASKKSIVEGSPELIAALRATDQEQAAKLEEPLPAAATQTRLSTTDPEAELVRRPGQSARLSYKQPRVVDDARGVITAQGTTGGSVPEDRQLMGLMAEHQVPTAVAAQTVVADSPYGTAENFLACADQFVYDAPSDTYPCPAGQILRRYQKRAHQSAWEDKASGKVCAQCVLRAHCTTSKPGRRIQRFERQAELDWLRAQANEPAARKNRRRGQHLSEGSFADATNAHGFKRSRWRRLWRQQIQNHLIAACQNVRILLRNNRPQRAAVAAMLRSPQTSLWKPLVRFLPTVQPCQFN